MLKLLFFLKKYTRSGEMRNETYSISGLRQNI